MFITALHNVEIKSNIDKGFVYNENVILINDPEYIRTIVSTFCPGFNNIIGSIEYNHLLSNTSILYIHDINIPKEHDPLYFLNTLILYAKCIFNAIWMVKDNAIDCELCFLYYNNQIYSNFISSVYSNALGDYDTIDINIDDLTLSKSFLNNFKSPFNDTSADKYSKESLSRNKLPYFNLEGSSRFSRFYYFFTSARANNISAVKIALYISSLETLFSTSSSELAHQISERIAFFLGNSSAEYKFIYSTIKKAYNIRSKTIHGDVIKKSDHKEVDAISMKLDNLIRKVFHKVLSEETLIRTFESPNNTLDEYYKDLIFGK